MKKNYEFQCFACPCEVIVDSDDSRLVKQIGENVQREAKRIEQKFSRYIERNIVHIINNASGCTVEVDPETAKLMDVSRDMHSLSKGLFDITSGVLRSAWRFSQDSTMPREKVIAQILPLVGFHKVEWNSPLITMLPNMQIDFGGIGKEYAVDQSARLVQEKFKIPVLINFGGDIFATAPPLNQSSWRIGIARSTSNIALRQGAVASSGTLHKHITYQGKIYSHIINPKTGYPLPLHQHRTITVCANTCIMAGFLSTVAILEGKNAKKFLNTHRVHYLINNHN